MIAQVPRGLPFCVLVATLGCTPSSGGGDDPADGSTAEDAAPPVDAAPHPDVAVVRDAAPDVGPLPDAAPDPDANRIVDAAALSDVGPDPDASRVDDARPPPDEGPQDAAARPDVPPPPPDAGAPACRVFDPEQPVLAPDPLVIPVGFPAFDMAARPDGGGFAVYYVVDDDAGGDATQALALIDPTGARITATAEMRTGRGRLRGLRAVWSGGHWWVGGIRQPGTGDAVLVIHRVSTVGRVLGEPIVVGPEADAFTFAPGAAGMGVLWRDGREQLVFELRDAGGGVVASLGQRVGVDSPVALAARGGDFLLGFEAIVARGPGHPLAQVWRDGELIGEPARVHDPVTGGYALVATPAGYAFAAEGLIRAPEPHFPLRFVPLDEDGQPGDPRTVWGEPGQNAESFAGLEWHGETAGYTLVEADFDDQIWLHRLDAAGRPFLVHRMLSDGEPAAAVTHFVARGAAPDIGHAWHVHRTFQVRFGVGALGGCIEP